MRCPRADEQPVVNEWQLQILCPNCKHYSCGECHNPTRKTETDECPIKNLEFKEVTENAKFKRYQKVKVSPDFVATIVNAQLSTIGMMYEVERDDNSRIWVHESFLE